MHLASGEASISLLDLHRLGGLPLHSLFYDEVIPCAGELTGSGDKRRFLPKCCEHLFAAYHFLRDGKCFDDRVLVKDWINFWFRGDLNYLRPPIRKGKRSACPKSIRNRNGLTRKRQSWKDTIAKAYVDLGIVDNKMNIYLTAFLSC